MHEAHDGGLPEQRSSAPPPRPNGWAQRSASADAPAFSRTPVLAKLTVLCWLDVEMPYVTAVSSRELHGSRAQRHGLCTAHSKAAPHGAPSRPLDGRCLRPIARLVPSGPMGRMRTRAARLGAPMQVRFMQVAQGAIFAVGRSAITRTITHGPKFTLSVLYFGRSLLVCRCDRRRRHCSCAASLAATPDPSRSIHGAFAPLPRPGRWQQPRAELHACPHWPTRAWGCMAAPFACPRSPRTCLLYTSPSPRDRTRSRMPSSA